jgi:hypothetical protein
MFCGFQPNLVVSLQDLSACAFLSLCSTANLFVGTAEKSGAEGGVAAKGTVLQSVTVCYRVMIRVL